MLKHFWISYLTICSSIFALRGGADEEVAAPTKPAGKSFENKKVSPWRLLPAYSSISKQIPQNRYCHVSSVCGNIMIVHGGASQTEHGKDIILSDTWGYNVKNQAWLKVTTTTSSTKEISGPTRVYHSLSTLYDTYTKDGSRECKILSFGGSTSENDNVALDDVNSLFELKIVENGGKVTGKWTLINPATQLKPAKRNEHVSVSYDNKLYIFGGMSGSNVKSLLQYKDIWMYDASENVWQEQMPKYDDDGIGSNGPSRRFSLAATLALPENDVDEASMLIFGGSNVDVYQNGGTGVNYLDDLWSYGLKSKVWKQLSAPEQAMKRTYMSLVMVGSSVLSFGGMSQKSTNRGPVHYVYNDVMKFDIPDKIWTRSADSTGDDAAKDGPSVRFGHTAVMIGKNEMIVFAGRFNSIYGDVWSLNTSVLKTNMLVPTLSDSIAYSDLLYYVFAIFVLVAICSCIFLSSMRQSFLRQHNNINTRITAQTGSALNGVAVELIQRLPTEIYSGHDLEIGAEEDIDNQCAVCMDDYNQGDELRILPCRHRFHSECVDPWLKQNKSCPLCKHEVDQECTTQSKAFLDRHLRTPSSPQSSSSPTSLSSAIPSSLEDSLLPSGEKNELAPKRNQVKQTIDDESPSMEFSASRHGVQVSSGENKER
jgi:N-acetylneuraminic acid mutarotase